MKMADGWTDVIDGCADFNQDGFESAASGGCWVMCEKIDVHAG